MTNYWEPGTQYNYGDVVSYDGVNYKIIQPHRSQGDWTPPVTPALWGRMQGGSGNNHGGQQQHNNNNNNQQQQHQNNNNNNNNNNQAPLSQNQQGSNDNDNQDSGNKEDGSGSEDEDGNKKWYKDGKKVAGIAGGILGGAALLGGGIAAYKHHQKKKDAEESAALAESGPVQWQRVSGRSFPPNAISGGRENSGTLYIIRGTHNGSTTPGKGGSHLKTGAVIGYGNKEIDLNGFEVLVGDPRSVRWVSVSGRFRAKDLDQRPVDGGKDTDGTRLLIARATLGGAIHPGKIAEGSKAAFIPWGGKETEAANYEVLVYDDIEN